MSSASARNPVREHVGEKLENVARALLSESAFEQAHVAAHEFAELLALVTKLQAMADEALDQVRAQIATLTDQTATLVRHRA